MTEPEQPQLTMTKVQGNRDYLDVANRLKWFFFDCDHNQWTREIVTELLEHTFDKVAVCKATITIFDSNGTVVKKASGHGSETPGDFRDYLEKAETKSIGRALGALGYSTETALDEEGLIVDAPRPARQVNQGGNSPQNSSRPSSNTGDRITDPQIRKVRAIIGKTGLTWDELNSITLHHDGEVIEGLAKRQAMALIDAIEKGVIDRSTYDSLPEEAKLAAATPQPEPVNTEELLIEMWNAAAAANLSVEKVEARIAQLHNGRTSDKLTAQEIRATTTLIKSIKA